MWNKKIRFVEMISGILVMFSLLCTPAFAASDFAASDFAASDFARTGYTVGACAADGFVSRYAYAGREQFTQKKGGGRDKVTIMVYMIGSDLESQYGMATSDLNEMLYAQMDNRNVNVFVQTGGCNRWRNSLMTAGKNERWRLSNGGLTLMERMKAGPMTDPDVLAAFIRFCAREAPADRYMLILWDHGGGSITGYGYDEKYPNDTMDIGEIGQALEMGGVQFDLVGFDACLMGTMETAIAVEPYADYLIASEETEPATGWYYTRWLQILDDNSSTNTVSLGRQIIDDFTSASASMDRRAATTLSLVDLAELRGSVLEYLGDFGEGLTLQLKGKDYQSVASARNGTREFAKGRRLDQVDLVDFCSRLGSREARLLASSIQDAVKYNKTNNVSGANGLSIYFPNSSLKSINSMLHLYDAIGMDPSWAEGVRTYATLESSGQIVANAGYSYGSSSSSLIDLLLGSTGGYADGYYANDTASDSYYPGSYYSDSSYPDNSYSESYYPDSSWSEESSQSSGGSILDLLFGGGSSSTYDSYDSMGVSDIFDILSGGSQAYTTGYNNGYDTYNNVYDSNLSESSYEDSLGDLFGNSSGDSSGNSSGSGGIDALSQLFGGYTTTSGDAYGGQNYSSMLGGYDPTYDTSYDYSSYDTGSGSLLGLAADLLFGRAPVGSETLRLTEKDGEDVLVLSEDKWEQVTAADLNVFIDDGDGFLDLGLDNVAEYNEDGDLIDTWDGTWLTLQGQPCAVYPISDEDADGNGLYITQKFIPALLNGERVNLIIEFNEETGEDRVLGAQSMTASGVVGRGYKEMNGGDIITLVCDYYDRDGSFQAQYTLGDPIIVPEDAVLSIVNKELTVPEGSRMLYTYRLTDLYQAHYWLPLKEG